MNIVITGTGSYLPGTIITNQHFDDSFFYDTAGLPLAHSQTTVVEKFKSITGIQERRYASPAQNMSDLAAMAAKKALENSGVDAEQIDAIILAHNFGNVESGSPLIDIMPCIATRVKHLLKIENPNCVAFDILFGCPGWVQALILARQYLIAENAKRILVVGGETLSRVIDPHDRDSMIYADGAGAVVLERNDEPAKNGILATCAQTHSFDQAYFLYYDVSNKKEPVEKAKYLKMDGKKIYEFALNHVPLAMKECLEKSGTDIRQLKKIFLHQANEKMDDAILKRFYKLYDISPPPEHVMPMNIGMYGNSSVASIPVLLDEVLNNKYPEHTLLPGDVILLASVGAGMSINAVTYKI